MENTYSNINKIIQDVHKIKKEKLKISKEQFYDFIYNNNKSNISNDLLSILTICKLIRKYTNDSKNLEYKANEELKDSKDNSIYKIIVCENDNKIKLFALFLLSYYIEIIIIDKSNFYLGMDFEFTNQEIALIQCNFETSYIDEDKHKFNYIWILNPNDMTDVCKKILIDNILTNYKIIKILHGSDSLDVPYIYKGLFEGNSDIFKKFVARMVDTRFICEHYKISQEEDKKCTIYGSLLDFDVIDQRKLDILTTIDARIGPKSDYPWDIHNLLDRHLEYTLYDVIYLKHLLLNIKKKAIEKTPELEKSYYIIPQLVRLVYLQKRDLIPYYDTIKQVVDIANNYWIIKKGDTPNPTLHSIYTSFIKDLILKESQVNVNYMFGINYMRKYLTIFFKFIVYAVAQKKYPIYAKKNARYTEHININIIYDNIVDYHRLVPFFKEFELRINKYI